MMRLIFCTVLTLSMLPGQFSIATAQSVSALSEQNADDLKEWNNQIRREKFDLVLPHVMKKNNVDIWIHVMREAICDPFGAEGLGSTSGFFVFTDHGGDRIERAVLGRRWGATQRQRGENESNLLEKYGVYDIIGDPVFVGELVSSPLTEYDFLFKGLREFVEARNPKRIAVNFRENLGTWATANSRSANYGITHIDYLLLTKELGDNYSDRLGSSEYVIIDYQLTPVPSEIALLKKLRKDEVVLAKKAFARIGLV